MAKRPVLFRALSLGTGALVVCLLVTPTSGHSSHHPAHMHMVPVPAAANVPIAPVLPRTGWTATASDQETTGENGVAANVLDGDPSTIWHSKWSGTSVPLPHSITIDMHAVTTVSALVYLPRPPASPNGRIGRFSISLSTGGSTWGSPVATGTWADDTTEKTGAFATASARYVRLTALTEAGNRGPWSSAAEINLLGAPTSTPPSYSVVPRTGWTATSSDEELVGENGSASNAIDGDLATIWHSKWSGTPTSLPHSITIDMKTPIAINGLHYLPRQTNGSNGTIGKYQVSLSTNGTTWSAPVAAGLWADNASEKTAAFTVTSARYVRLTALTEAGNRGPWSSAAEINVLQPVNPAVAGTWGPLINFPIVPVSAVLLPNNKLLTFSAYQSTSYGMDDGYTQTAILDLATGVVSQRQVSNTGHEMFCTGLALLPDGRVLVNGGSDSGKTSIYNPATDAWTAGPTMNIPRGYEGDTTLSDGSVFTLGGSWSGGEGNKNAEVFTPSGSWRLVKNVTAASILTSTDPQGVYREDNHGWFFATSNAGVFHAGPSKQMNWFTTAGDGTTRSAGLRADSADTMNGNAVMYDVGKILTDGGATAYQDVDATRRAYTIDISKGPSSPVTVQRVGDMAVPRAFQNSVVLPSGQVFVVGGQAHPVPFTDTGAAMSPELWNPATGQFSTMASQAEPRNYHSVALLLPDGRVFSGGGGLCGTCATNHPDGQIFTPPYLLNADGSLKTRPVISSAPASARLGSTINVTTNTAVTSFAVVRMGAVTHTVDSDQRRIPLTPISHTGTTYQLRIPSDPGIALPGNYLLFALDSAGTPSVAQTVAIAVS
ncbi:MAG TPA: discoidin domain-containing protein [Jatrophihabitantaceae bacterium]|nr:discoidin domain-containing protein [Jatrophihabitantaceae bacterium]